MKTTAKVVLVLAIAFPAGSRAALESLPVGIEREAVAPHDVQFMTLGAPEDSLVLRVSLCAGHTPHVGPYACVIVEELRWPPPAPRTRVDGTDITFEHVEDEWLLRVTRIDGGVLKRACHELPQAAAHGVRPGVIGATILQPFEFVAWLTPREFAIRGNDGRFVIRRTGPGSFALTEVQRIR